LIQDSTVRALVSLTEDAEGGFHLAVALHAKLSGIDSVLARRVMEMAHQTCPYSRALRGDSTVTLTVD
jgi:organic hydroperoxide reductase OsmC/OhrA